MAVTLITPTRCERDISWAFTQPNLEVVFDEQIVGYTQVRGYLEANCSRLTRKGRSMGWYLQQYLKIAFAWERNTLFFIHDGDTVFSPSLLKRQEHSPFLMTTREKTVTYNAVNRALGLPTYDRSFVANGAIFVPSVLRELAKDPAQWFIDIMEAGVIGLNAKGDLSEYQLMGSMLKDHLPIVPFKIFRRFDLLVPHPPEAQNLPLIKQALTFYDAVAFEYHHASSTAKRCLAQIAFWAHYKW